MKKFLSEFRDFAMKGNVFDMAVGIVVGGAFSKIVTALVNDLIMPLVGILMHGIDLGDLSFTFQKAAIKYGDFIQSVVDFLIIALSIFLFIKGVSKFRQKFAPPPPKEEPAPISRPEDVLLLEEIRDLLKNK